MTMAWKNVASVLALACEAKHLACTTGLHTMAGGAVVLAGYFFHSESSFNSTYGSKLYNIKELSTVDGEVGWMLSLTRDAYLPNAPIGSNNQSEIFHPILVVSLCAGTPACTLLLHAKTLRCFLSFPWARAASHA